MPVTVKDLKKQLEALPDDMVLVMQADDEGNSYRYMRGVDGPAKGKSANYFNTEDRECYRGEDLKDMGRKRTDADLQLCAVVY